MLEPIHRTLNQTKYAMQISQFVELLLLGQPDDKHDDRSLGIER